MENNSSKLDSKNNEVVTFGCRLNIYESEVISEKLNAASIENAIVFNTCAVTKEAERQARQAIRKYRKANPDKKIIVTGCSAQINPNSYAQMSEVDLILGNEEKFVADNYKSTNTERLLVNDIMSVKETASHMVSSFQEYSRAFVQIQNGCNHRCTFCTIPYARGNSRSITITEIVNQSRMLVEKGFKEIVLTGVDITDYGLDLPGKPSLGQMITRLLNLVPNLERLRLSSIDVAEIDDELFNLLAYEKRVMPHIHISLQAGDNMILKRMKRRHNREQVIEFCQKLAALRPEIAFGADIIAGFPTETDAMFLNSYNLIKEANLTLLHVFPYSEREGTPASRMPQVEKSIRKERAKLLREAGQKQLSEFLKYFVGRKFKALIEEENIARLENFLPVKLVDPSTISQIKSDERFKSETEGVYKLVHDRDRILKKGEVSFKNGNWYSQSGDIVDVLINDSDEKYLYGTLVG